VPDPTCSLLRHDLTRPTKHGAARDGERTPAPPWPARHGTASSCPQSTRTAPRPHRATLWRGRPVVSSETYWGTARPPDGRRRASRTGCSSRLTQLDPRTRACATRGITGDRRACRQTSPSPARACAGARPPAAASTALPHAPSKPVSRDRPTAAFPLRGTSDLWAVPGSNRRPPACKAGALPAELTARLLGRPPAAARPADRPV
jgi:hypothetical protein